MDAAVYMYQLRASALVYMYLVLQDSRRLGGGFFLSMYRGKSCSSLSIGDVSRLWKFMWISHDTDTTGDEKESGRHASSSVPLPPYSSDYLLVD